MSEITPIPGGILFYFQYSSVDPAIQVTLPPDMQLEYVLDAFEGFLLAAGYVLNGKLCVHLPEPDGNIELN